jgi:hypothetical protein
MIIVSPSVFGYQIVASIQRETKRQCHHHAKSIRRSFCIQPERHYPQKAASVIIIHASIYIGSIT